MQLIGIDGASAGGLAWAVGEQPWSGYVSVD